MKTDYANPSIICAGFGKFDERFEKFKFEASKKGIVVREIKLFDIQIPVNEYQFNSAVNFLKENTHPILKSYLWKLPFKKLISKILKNKMKLEFFDYKLFEKDFIESNMHPFGYFGLTPLFVDSKYKGLDVFDNWNEKWNYEDLFSLKSVDYKPLLTPTKEEKYFKKIKKCEKLI